MGKEHTIFHCWISKASTHLMRQAINMPGTYGSQCQRAVMMKHRQGGYPWIPQMQHLQFTPARQTQIRLQCDVALQDLSTEQTTRMHNVNDIKHHVPANQGNCPGAQQLISEPPTMQAALQASGHLHQVRVYILAALCTFRAAPPLCMQHPV